MADHEQSSNLDGIELVNLADGYPITLSFNTSGLLRYVMLPNYSLLEGTPGSGSVTIFDADKHLFTPEYLRKDGACGILLGKFKARSPSLEKLVKELLEKGERVSLMEDFVGKGDHFINIYEDISSPKEVYVAIHTSERKTIEINKGTAQEESIQNGRDIRKNILNKLKEFFGEDIFCIWDRPHITFELDGNRIIYRRGAVKIDPGEAGLITSSFNDDAILFRATQNVARLENSICHGTGRVVLLSGNADRREAFRGIWKVEKILEPYIEVTARLRPLGVDSDYIYRIERKVREELESLSEQELSKMAYEFSYGQRAYYGDKEIEPIGRVGDNLLLDFSLLSAWQTIAYLSENEPGRGKSRRGKERLKKDRFLEIEKAFEKKFVLEKILQMQGSISSHPSQTV